MSDKEILGDIFDESCALLFFILVFLVLFFRRGIY